MICSIANLFDTNIRKLDTKETVFFCPECLDSVNHQEFFFFKNRIYVFEAEL